MRLNLTIRSSFSPIVTMSLNFQQLECELSRLDASMRMPIYGFETLPSTDRTAWELLASGHNPPFAVIARQQSAGQGQWGRQWLSETGGLYLSLVLALDLGIDRSPHLLLATAWGMASKLRSHEIPVSIKWPNDLVLTGKKLGGLKITTKIRGTRLTSAVIGVGINGSNPVPETGINLQSFWGREEDRSLFSLEQLAIVTIEGIFGGYHYYLSRGIEALLSVHQELFANLGQEISIGGCSGIITGVSDRGELKVRLSTSGATTEICLPTGTISLGYNQENFSCEKFV
jgi:BirA family biotin operon repressor/biotin-[acetyl-CoA-carboxylase] ligase